MLVYVLKSSICLTAFLAFYKLCLEKENIHHFKRYYLLFAIAMALGIPLITFTTYIESLTTTNLTPHFLQEINTPVETPFEELTINYLPIVLWSLYSLGVIIFGIRFIRNLSKIIYRIKNNLKYKKGNIVNVLLLNVVSPHTFFKYIFLNKQKFEAQEIPQEVLWHEEAHANQKHSIDILIIELLQVILWFNPVIYFIKKTIKLNHEFLADQAVLNKGTSNSTYQEILLAFSSSFRSSELANAINDSSIKKRFTIMKKRTSTRQVWIKSVLLLPILAILLYSFSERIEIEKEVSNNSDLTGSVKTENELILLVHKDGTIELNIKRFEKEQLKEVLKNYKTSNDIIIAYEWEKGDTDLKLSQQIEAICRENGFNSVQFYVQYGNTPDSKNENAASFTKDYIKEYLRLNRSSWSLIISSFRRHKSQYKKRLNQYKEETAKSQKEFNYLASLWNDLLADYQSIPPSERKSFSVTMPAHPNDNQKTIASQNRSEKNPLYARSIDLKIKNNGSFQVDNIKTSKQNLQKTLAYIHTDLTKEQREKVINIHVSSQEKISYQDLVYIQKVAKDYGYHRIVTPYEEIVRTKGNTPVSDSTNSGLKAVSKDIIIFIDSKNQILLQNNDQVIKASYLEKGLQKFNKGNFSEKDLNDRKILVISDIKASLKFTKEIISRLSKMGFKNISTEKSSRFTDLKIPPPPPPVSPITPKAVKKGDPGIPPLPPPAKKKPQKQEKIKTGFLNIKGEKHYYVTIDRQSRYYNRQGVEVTKNGKILNNGKQTNATDVIPGQYVSAVYQNNKIVSTFYKNENDIDIEEKSVPTKLIAPEKSVLEYLTDASKKDSKFYYNDKLVTPEFALKIVKNNKEINILTRNTDLGKTIIKLKTDPITDQDY